MKALTLTQPWASLVALGEKRVETRSWGTHHRGPLAIHAAAGFPSWARDLCATSPFRQLLAPLGATSTGTGLPLGAVLAVARLVACERMTVNSVSFVTGQERALGDWRPGRFAWVLDEILPLAAPVAARGALGLWEWPAPSRAAAQS